MFTVIFAHPRKQIVWTHGLSQGRNHASKFGGSNRAKPESSEARIEGAKSPRFEGEARIEGEAGKGSGEGAR